VAKGRRADRIASNLSASRGRLRRYAPATPHSLNNGCPAGPAEGAA
jgi:hypothetical protein